MKKNLFIYFAVVLTFGATVFFSGCSDDNPLTPTSTTSDKVLNLNASGPETNTYGPDVAIAWYNLEFRLIRQTSLGFTPPVAARAFGYTGIALYESVVPGMPLYKSLKNQLNGFVFLSEVTPGNYHWPTSANAALANIVRKLFTNATPANNASIDSLEEAFNTVYQSQVDSATFARSKEFGKEIAYSVYRWSTTDHGREGQLHNTDPTYVPPVGPGLWVPTPPALASALQPRWGNNRPFITSNITTNQPPSPIPFSTNTNSTFYAEELEVYTTGISLSTEQRNIALFWADGGGTFTPAGHWIAITQQILNSLNSKLDVAALAFTKVGISQTDAFISCWKTKFIYNVLRPITYIRTYIDSTWSPLIGTPPFPDYTSGHSSQSGAASQVLSDMFGYNVSFTDNSHPELAIPPRSFTSFYQASEEAAISRLYGGIHYRSSNERGVQCGRQIGMNVSA
ncbi:MAG: vanadium-dependent haloperoxidase, partial [bacterium]